MSFIGFLGGIIFPSKVHGFNHPIPMIFVNFVYLTRLVGSPAGFVIVTGVSKLAYFTYLRDVSNLTSETIHLSQYIQVPEKTSDFPLDCPFRASHLIDGQWSSWRVCWRSGTVGP